ncbi:MAG: hypothetical protein KGZ42_09660 [Melioribacter sp.]|nr:hypothetical protein [Melioribacter sp.]
MKNKIYLINLLFFLLTNYSNILSQSFYGGLKGEAFFLRSQFQFQPESKFYVTSFYLFGGMEINKNIKLDLQYGILLSEGNRYNGFETGLIFKYFLRENKEFVSCGVLTHKNSGTNSFHHISKSNYLLVGTIGLGTYLTDILFIQLSYQIPIGENQYADFRYWDVEKGMLKEPILLINLIKFSIGISFDF